MSKKKGKNHKICRKTIKKVEKLEKNHQKCQKIIREMLKNCKKKVKNTGIS